MTSDDSTQRILRQLRATIVRLAEAADAQRAYLRDLGTPELADELALEFGDVAEVATRRPGLLTPDQRRAIADLDRQLNEMSGGGGDSVWATDALLASEWVTVRELATIALRQLRAAGT